MCAGIYAMVKGKLGDIVPARIRALPLTLIGVFLFAGALIADGYKAPAAAVFVLLAWTCLWAGTHGVIKGRLGPLHGRMKTAVILGAAVPLFISGAAVQSSADKVTAAAATQKRAADTESRYVKAVSLHQEKKLDEAIVAFTDLKDFKDSAARLIDAQYELAGQHIQQKSWDKAMKLIALIPTTYKDSPVLLTAAKDGLTSELYGKAMAAKQKKDYKEAERLFAEAQNVGGKAPGDIAAERNAVVEARTQAEKIEAERIAKEKEHQARVDAEAGPKPTNSAWDAEVLPVTSFLKKNLKDPASVEYVEWSPVTLVESKGMFYWAVRCKYRAKNSFGGYALEQKLFLIQQGQVVSYSDI